MKGLGINPPTLRGSKRLERVSKGNKILRSMTYRPAPGLPSPFARTDLVQPPPPEASRSPSRELRGPPKLTKLVSRGLSAQKLTFWTLFCRISKEKTSKIQPCSDIVLALLQRKSKARTRDKMLQIHWYLRVGSDVRHFCKVWKNVKTSLEKEQNRARF